MGCGLCSFHLTSGICPPRSWLKPLLAAFFLFSVVAQSAEEPVEETWFINEDLRPEPLLELCPRDTYRNQIVTWNCGHIEGRVFLTVQPFEKGQTALEIPIGLSDLSLNITAVISAEMMLQDSTSDEPILVSGDPHRAASYVQRLSHRGMTIQFRGHNLAQPSTEALRIPGKVTFPMALLFSNAADEWGIVAMDYSYRSLRPCPTIPPGCLPFNEYGARQDLASWVAWAHSRYSSAEAAWEALALPPPMPSVRNTPESVAHAAAAGLVSWFRWKAVWQQADSSRHVSQSWQPVFHLLDANRDQFISLQEFVDGFTSRTLTQSWHFGMSWASWSFWLLLVVAAIVGNVWMSCRNPSKTKTYHNPQSKQLQEDARNPMRSEDTLEQSKDTRSYAALEAADQIVQEEPCRPPPFKPVKGGQVVATVGQTSSTTPSTPKSPDVPNERGCGGGAWGADCQGRNKSRDKQATSPGKMTPDRSTPSKQDSFVIQGSKQVSHEQAMPQDLPPLQMAEAVIGRMMLERQNQPLQEWACERLEELALRPGGQAAIATHGGIGALLETMRRYPFSCYLQECACGALGNQSLRSEECQHSILGQGGLEQIITAMKENLLAPRLQEKALWALEQLALTTAGRQKIIEHGGLECVVRGMQTHLEDEHVQEHGCMALANLSFESEPRMFLAQFNGVTVVLNAMRRHVTDAVVQEDACFALHNMACSDELMRLIAEQEGLEAIVQAMATHQQTPAIIESACSALHNVGANGEYSLKLVGLGGLGLIVQAMEAHPANPGLAAQACHVLGLLSLAGPEIREELQRVGAVKVIVATMQTLPASPDVQDAGQEALRLFTA